MVTKLKKLILWKKSQNSNCDKTNTNSSCDKIQMVKKLYLWHNSNCDKTQNMQLELWPNKKLKLWKKTQKLNLWKKNYKTQIMTKLKLWQISIFNKKYFKKSLLVRTFWHLDNPWYVLWAAFRDSCNVFEDKLQFNVNELKEMFQICKSIVIWILCVMVRHHCISP